MSLTPDQLRALEGASCGPLCWQPPVGVHRQLDGSRRGQAPHGFSIQGWGANTPPAPKMAQRTLTFTEALRVAAWLDDIGTEPSNRQGYDSAVAWVTAVIELIPEAYAEAIAVQQRALTDLASLQAEARGFVAARSSWTPAPLGHRPDDDDDDDRPF